jgi:hypothetical protein
MDNFGIIKGDNVPHGLFGATMTWILEILPFLKKKCLYPNWDINTQLYGKIIPGIINPKRVNTESKTIESLMTLKKLFAHEYTENECSLANELFFEYFDISPEILYTVALYEKKLIGKTLGIHFRGTDKIKSDEADYISKDMVINNIFNYLKSNTTYTTILIISDESEFIDKMLDIFSNKDYNIVCTNAKKSFDSNYPIHYQANCNIEFAKEAMVDSLILSKCDYVIKTSSCLSDWIKIWNPTIEVYNLNKFNYNWFPQSIIPVKSY